MPRVPEVYLKALMVTSGHKLPHNTALLMVQTIMWMSASSTYTQNTISSMKCLPIVMLKLNDKKTLPLQTCPMKWTIFSRSTICINHSLASLHL